MDIRDHLMEKLVEPNILNKDKLSIFKPVESLIYFHLDSKFLYINRHGFHSFFSISSVDISFSMRMLVENRP